jgi:hypothetical protein
MLLQPSDLPHAGFLHRSQPHQPQLPPVQAPMVYVYERQAWEYDVVVKNEEELPSEEELNALGSTGWELAGVVAVQRQVHFYFKRVRH